MMNTTKYHIIHKFSPLLPAFLFISAFKLSLIFYPLINLPFSNPWQVVGPLAIIKYNPYNNILRYIFLIIFPSLLLITANYIPSFGKLFSPQSFISREYDYPSLENRYFQYVIYFLTLGVLFLIAGDFRLYYDGSNSVALDTYHEGETLGTAIDYLHHKVPYKEAIFAHGLFEDPLRAVLSFSLFGKSIAAVRTLSLIIYMLINVIYILVLYYLFNRNILLTLLAVILLMFLWKIGPWNLGFEFWNRDLLLMIVLLITIVIKKEIIDNNSLRRQKINVLLYLLTFVSVLGFLYSHDRGFYLTIVSLIYVFTLYFLYLRRLDNKYILPILMGYLAGVITLGLGIKWCYYDFFQFVFLTQPGYWDLMDGLPYDFSDYRDLLPIFLMAAVLYWLVYRFIDAFLRRDGALGKTLKLFLDTYLLEIFLLVIAIFFYRNALNRSDYIHVILSSGPVYLLIMYIILKHYLPRILEKTGNPLFCLIALDVIVLSVFMINYLPRITFSNWYRFPLGLADQKLIPANYQKTISFLKDNLTADESFYTMTSEGSWYYFLNKPCPTRFQIVWFAVPYFYQKEVIEDLQKGNVKYILYRNSNVAQKMDGIPIEAKVPLIFAFLQGNYEFYTKIDDQEIWVKRGRNRPPPQKP